VSRLLTFADIDKSQPDSGFHVKARHELELNNGTRVLLLDDRGWGASPWKIAVTTMSLEDIERMTRTVVGPDEAYGDMSQEDMEADHWAALEQTARQQGVSIEAAELKRLTHDVVFTPRLLAYLREGQEASSRPD
jgi:hypothetical protein